MKKPMSKKTKAMLLIAGLVGGTVLVMTGILLPWIIPAVQHEVLKASVNDFLAPTAGSDKSGGPYVTGKVIVIDNKTHALDPVQNRLPSEIRAYSAGEVGTVVLLEWGFETVEGDWGGAKGHYSTCKVTVIDRGRNLVVGEHTVIGASSAVATGAGRGPFRAPKGTMTARRANNEVAGYIKGLPRR